MDLTPYIDRLRRDLAVAAEAGGDEARALADRLSAPLESAAQLVLLEALTAATEEITVELAPGSVEVRLRGREPDFVVTLPPSAEGADVSASDDADRAGSEPGGLALGVAGRDAFADEGGTARLNLRLPETLKARMEEAARAEGLSLNAWLVRAAAAALDAGERRSQHARPGGASGGQRFTGWVR
ncbi:toxin-antitoxin system HicB family antitoxin [Egibacter rhizosphaerae]|uniref:Toxin-antitoxin system HicB family antitoxin n=1 Tax=Egibacter rhizosphaerae TaxID=1670831 RepID=A0A411YB85_9ACTN|nr:toxin-antitoxin system HicB family antitoxin [Egibacter rhizosphaerae]QBI18456.1 toxin-antitoxin system HicB family antitoxin [Egibacter rhizosphaerae]